MCDRHSFWYYLQKRKGEAMKNLIVGSAIVIVVYIVGAPIVATYFPCLVDPNGFSCRLERNVEKLKKQNAEN
jgi:hypothetical protein